MKRNSKIAIILGFVAILFISAALVIHFRLSESEKSEIQSGSEQNEKETASQVANEIVNSIQNKPNSESNENGESPGTSELNETAKQTTIPTIPETATSIQNKPNSESNENGESPGTSESNESAEQATPSSIPTTIAVKQVDGVYRWSNATSINPVITLTEKMKNPIHFTNPTDTKHSFVIEQNGTIFLATKDLEAGKSGSLSINPTVAGVFDYHCKYHPDTMKGILIVVP